MLRAGDFSLHHLRMTLLFSSFQIQRGISNSFFKHGKCDWGWPPGHATHVVPWDPMGTRACQAQLNAAAILKFQILLEPGALPFHAALGPNVM